MMEQVTRSDVADLRSVLIESGYSEAMLIKHLGTAAPPAPMQMAELLHRTRSLSPFNALARLFLLGSSLDSGAARDTLPGSFIDMALQNGLLALDGDRLLANIVVVPVGDLLFASDSLRKLGDPERTEFVLPARTRATDFLRRLTIRVPVERTLDLGCGCGVHALLAARHSESVVATDISLSATVYTRFNAQLNELDNVQVLVGDGFEPVAEQSFNLIISNPPFIIGPNQDFTYRDNPLELDDFCRSLVRQAPQYLADQGVLQILCEWVEVDQLPGRERVQAWVQGLGCDTWVLRTYPQTPERYVSQRMLDQTGAGLGHATGYGEWLDYFESRSVTGINKGMLVLRRRDDDNWLNVLTISAEPDRVLEKAVEQRIAACEFLDLCKEDDSLLAAILRLAPNTELEQTYTMEEGGWKTRRLLLRLKNGLPVENEIDVPVMAFLDHIDGARTLKACIASFCELAGADETRLSRELLPAIRLFIGNGVLEPV